MLDCQRMFSVKQMDKMSKFSTFKFFHDFCVISGSLVFYLSNDIGMLVSCDCSGEIRAMY